jgi:hypothetical protein
LLAGKQELTQALRRVEMEVRQYMEMILMEFELNKDGWNAYRFAFLTDHVKRELDWTVPLDFGKLYEHFHRDQSIDFLTMCSYASHECNDCCSTESFCTGRIIKIVD